MSVQPPALAAILLTLAALPAAAQPAATGSIAGHIVQPDATPAADATVIVMTPAAAGGEPVEVARTTSGPGGAYELIGLPAGDYLVAARPAPGAFLGHDALSRAAVTTFTIYPGVPEAGQGTRVPVFDGMPTEGIDIWLLPAPRRFTLSGRAWDADTGRRLRNVAIEYSDETGLRRGVWLVTDPDGYFVIDGVPPGRILLLARGDSEGGPMAGHAAAVIESGPAEDVRLRMGPTGSVAGRLHAEGAPAWSPAGARVTLVHVRQQVSILYPVAEAVTDADGRFRLPRAFGTYRLDVSGLPEGWRVVRVRSGGREVDDSHLRVSHGEQLSDVEVVVGPASARPVD
jgi:hypothetical protein